MRIQLVLIRNGRTIQRIELEDPERVAVGRDPDCDLVIDNEAVSRNHCELIRHGEVYKLRDLGSGNGTYVHGRRIDRPFNLNHGDLIELAKFSVRFEDDSPRDAPTKWQKPTSGRLTALAGFNRQQLAHHVAYFDLDDDRQVLLEKSAILIGKRSDCDVQAKGRKCPVVAAVLISTETGFRLLDVSPQSDSIRVNGVPNRDTWLDEEDTVQVGDMTLVFHRGRPLGV